MLIVQYKPSSNIVAVADSNIKSVAESFMDGITFEEHKVVIISQLLLLDGIRAVLVEKNIDPSLVHIEVYNEDGEFCETVNITEHFAITSWESFPAVQFDLLKTICKSGKYEPTK